MLEKSFTQWTKTGTTYHLLSRIQLLYFLTPEFPFDSFFYHFYLSIDIFYLMQHCQCTFLYSLITISFSFLNIFTVDILKSSSNSTSGWSHKYFQLLALFLMYGLHIPVSLYVLKYFVGKWIF